MSPPIGHKLSQGDGLLGIHIHEYLDWGIVLKSTGKLIGTCGFTSVDLEHSKGEIGYVLNKAYRNLGYGTEAVNRVLEYAFEDLELNI